MVQAGVNDNWEKAGALPGRAASFSTVALFGVTAIVAQVLLLRECLIVVAGNELFIALFYGCWFVGIAVGAAVGSFWKARARRLVPIVSTFLLLQVLLLPALMISLRDVRSRWDLPAWQVVPFAALLRMAAMHLCPFSLLTGLTFPLLCRLTAARQSAGGKSIGWVYAIESLGSLVGGIVVTFVFAVYCRPLTAAWALVILTAANLAWFSQSARGRFGRTLGAFAAATSILFLLGALSPVRSAVERWSASLRHQSYAPQFEWLEERYTPYQHLALARLGEQFSLLSNGQFIASFPDPHVTSQTAHLMMSQTERPERILVIGGEIGVLQSLLRYPQLTIDYVEIDPQVLGLVRPYLGSAQQSTLEDRRIRIHHEDARRFVQRRIQQIQRGSGQPYDAVLCRVPDPSTAALNRFYTIDFFREVRRLLAERGVLVTSISSSENYFDREMLDYVGSVHQALTETFGHVLATPGQRAFLFATASDDLLTSDVERLIGRFDARGIADGGFSPLFFHTAYATDQLQLVNRSLRRALGSVRTNSDAEPVTYLYHLRLWNRLSGARSQRFFRLIERYNWRAVLWFCLLLLLARAATHRRWPMTSDRAAHRHGIVALFLTGMAGMVASIVLLLLFQNFHGSLYRDVGLLVALFMAGLTVGGLSGNRIGKSEKGALLIGMGLCALGFAIFFATLGYLIDSRFEDKALGKLLDSAAFFYVTMILAGALTGVQFPLVGRLAVACGHDPGRAGGVLEAIDHLGACLGAFLTGIVLIPVSGLAATLAVFVALEAVAGISSLPAGLAVLLRKP